MAMMEKVNISSLFPLLILGRMSWGPSAPRICC
jgi:hypothetical protein